PSVIKHWFILAGCRLTLPRQPLSPLSPYTTLFRSNGIRTLGSHQPGNPSADEVGRAQPQAVQETALARSGDTQSHRVGGGLIHWGVASQGVSTSSNSPGRQLLSNQLSSGP